MDKTLIIFMKNPQLGKVKSRLAKSIGEEKALKVYHHLLERCREQSRSVNAKRCLFYSDTIEERDRWSEKFFEKYLQKGNGLGERLLTAMQSVMEINQDQRIVIIGSDCYDLDHQKIESAFEALNFSDLVIGPANDGGYYLIGLKKGHKELFEGIEWSSDKVLGQTIAVADQLNLSYFLLEELIDLDTFDDLNKSGFPKEFL